MREFFKENVKIASEIEAKLREKLLTSKTKVAETKF